MATYTHFSRSSGHRVDEGNLPSSNPTPPRLPHRDVSEASNFTLKDIDEEAEGEDGSRRNAYGNFR